MSLLRWVVVQDLFRVDLAFNLVRAHGQTRHSDEWGCIQAFEVTFRCFTMVWFDRFFLLANAVALLSPLVFLKRVESAIDLGRRWLKGLRYRRLKELWEVLVLLDTLENAKRLNLSLVDLLWWELGASREGLLWFNLLNSFNFLASHVKRLVLRELLLWILQASYVRLLGRVWDCALKAHLHWL